MTASSTEYGMVSVQRASDRTDEVERFINEMAAHGWEIIGYSAHGWRGMTVEGYSHLILLRRERRRDEGPEFRCFRCGIYCWPEKGKRGAKCRNCGKFREPPSARSESPF